MKKTHAHKTQVFFPSSFVLPRNNKGNGKKAIEHHTPFLTMFPFHLLRAFHLLISKRYSDFCAFVDETLKQSLSQTFLMSFDVFILSFCNEQGVKSKHEKAMNKKKPRQMNSRFLGSLCVSKSVFCYGSVKKGVMTSRLL